MHPKTAAADDEMEIRDLVLRADRAQSDPERLLELHTPETVIVNLAGRRILGRDAFGTAMIAALASSLSEVTTSLEVVDVRFVAPAVAVVSCKKTVHDGRSGATTSSPLPDVGALTFVVTKSATEWQIAVAQTTPVLQAPIDNSAS